MSQPEIMQKTEKEDLRGLLNRALKLGIAEAKGYFFSIQSLLL